MDAVFKEIDRKLTQLPSGNAVLESVDLYSLLIGAEKDSEQ